MYKKLKILRDCEQMIQFYRKLDTLPDVGGLTISLITNEDHVIDVSSCKMVTKDDCFINFYPVYPKRKNTKIDMKKIKGWRTNEKGHKQNSIKNDHNKELQV